MELTAQRAGAVEGSPPPSGCQSLFTGICACNTQGLPPVPQPFSSMVISSTFQILKKELAEFVYVEKEIL